MHEDTGASSAGLRGTYIPSGPDLYLLRDGTLSRDACAVLAHALSAHLRQTGGSAILLAAHAPPASYTRALKRLGAPAIDIVDARGGGGSGTSGGGGSDVLAAVAGAAAGSVVVLDSAQALERGGGACVGEVVRTALGKGMGAVVAIDFDEGDDFGELEDLATTVVDLVPLPKAKEFDGRVSVQKIEGKWLWRPVTADEKRKEEERAAKKCGVVRTVGSPLSFLYSVHDSGAVKYYN